MSITKLGIRKLDIPGSQALYDITKITTHKTVLPGANALASLGLSLFIFITG